MFKVIIAGGRDFTDYPALVKFCDKILKNKKLVEIVSGTAKGADKLGEKYAIEKNFGLKSFPAPWNDIEGKPESEIGTTKKGRKYWKKAGAFRNQQMADYADALIAFHDGKSRGTADMITKAEIKKLPTRVGKYKNK